MIGFLDKWNSFPGVLLPEIGASGVWGIILIMVMDGGVDKSVRKAE